jgi:hypothetical protein
MREWFATNPDSDPDSATNWSDLAAEALAFARSEGSENGDSGGS